MSRVAVHPSYSNSVIPAVHDLTGSLNIERVALLVARAVERLCLDLREHVVLTEVGTGIFAATPVIAAYAGARVIALARDTTYGLASEAIVQSEALRARLKVSGSIRYATRDTLGALTDVDIITNLANVRPLDAALLARADPTRVVIAYMCEAWEVRAGDVDFDYCREHGIPVAGTNEAHPLLDCFRLSGAVVARLLLERGFELLGGYYVVVSPDRFGEVVSTFLRNCGARVETLGALGPSDTGVLETADAIVLADYTSTHLLIGDGVGDVIAATEVVRSNPAVEVIRLAGLVDDEACAKAGLRVHPPEPLGAQRMSRTLAYAGPRPVIDLHAGGLKVGELLKRGRMSDLIVQLI